ncbi:uncharacterized protein BDCG_05591 [Blastomyces dermatitidis ER-3]|uniref:Microbial-type PARG catalytic domain-containing protein n=3 Tax=Blastomyces TaxID=229219 RepID=A0A179UT37_BLAGS|nr:uncharacterized protein BDBG_05871 [Blastomyces gilchristii SLH14081]XP_045277201.1 uncharacterized protein BDCG_05591 [Blastomyces dermatitidis ER-3]EGE83919.1 mitochondrial chaperone BCS1 [Blastomyces dermatitidis ATCC 18188]EQL32060.1 hypothetical protein BDFG_05651 [Blastomyces dermatitidis ATCC 26199]EEQ90471.1 hypothetical protein BDCG_05591 [Blastomyces dermatitidis ER-3]OAT10201.1 hypothetical protein BDBG_05871 [Blastomyces gilchristii SLH14081]
MADPPNRKLVQTVLNLHPERRRDLGTSRSPYFVRQSPNGDVANGLSNDSQDRMEDIQPTPPRLQSQEVSNISTSTDSSYDAGLERKRAIQARRKELSAIAAETTSLLPNILATAPHAPPKGYLYAPPQPPRLSHHFCPNLPPTAIRIHDADTFDTAIGLEECSKFITIKDKKPVCVLNMANAHNAGGGWKRGALAQEEALCYRSSLSFSLKLRYYPLPEMGAIYSPTVLVIRANMDEGEHKLLDLSQPDKLPVVSVISVAALCVPDVRTREVPGLGVRQVYKNPTDREIMKEKMRVALRTAVVNQHRRLVLGALGCGAFANPKEEVADCWAEVFQEREFSGGWWESIIFAVMDDRGEGEDGDGNFGVFYRRLNGVLV